MAKGKSRNKTGDGTAGDAEPTVGAGPGSQSDAGQAADPVDAFMLLLAEKGWLALSLADVAERCGLSLAALYRRYPSKTALLRAFAVRIDEAMLEGLGPRDTTGSARDRLFEALMARFDALAPFRPAIRVMGRELPRDPVAAICFASGSLTRALDWCLAAAGLDTRGLPGLARRKVLGAVYLDTLRVWIEDDSADMAATMAHLDKRLGQAERLLGLGRINTAAAK